MPDEDRQGDAFDELPEEAVDKMRRVNEQLGDIERMLANRLWQTEGEEGADEPEGD